MSTPLAELLSLVADEEGLSIARACKRLGRSRSELRRQLTQLGDDAAVGGLDLVRVRRDGARETLWLSDRARAARSGGAS